MTRNVKAAVEKARVNAGLKPVYDAPLTKGTCEKCNRGYYFKAVPKVCVWPACGGTLKAETPA